MTVFRFFLLVVVGWVLCTVKDAGQASSQSKTCQGVTKAKIRLDSDCSSATRFFFFFFLTGKWQVVIFYVNTK